MIEISEELRTINESIYSLKKKEQFYFNISNFNN